jgi:hypothetical protein
MKTLLIVIIIIAVSMLFLGIKLIFRKNNYKCKNNSACGFCEKKDDCGK